MKHTRLFTIALATLVLSAGFTSCSCSGGKTRSLVIIDPVDGQTLTVADDLNADTPGIQIEVTVEVRGFDAGDRIDITVTNDIEGTDRDFIETYDGTGTILIGPITLQGGTTDDPGLYTFLAYSEEYDVQSDPVSVDVVADVVTCPNFDFIDPVDGDTWNQADDSNDDPSDGFQHDVVITTDAGDAETVTLYLDGASVGTTTVDGTIARFEDVTFSSGLDSVVLRVQTTDSCTAEAMVYLDTDAPTCTISAPVATDPAGWINATFDVSSSDGMQADVVIETEGDATVELFVDTPITGDPTLTLTADASGSVTFSAVELAEADLGTLTLQARCTDTAGNPGASSRNEYGVDSVLPTINITAPTADTYYNDEDDVDTENAGVQIEMSVTTDQPSWPVELMECGGVPYSSDHGIPTTDTMGDATGWVSLGGVAGPVDLCATVVKPSGNAATAGPVTVTLDTEAPDVMIVDPVNGQTILAADDENPVDTLCQYTITVECEWIGGTVTVYDGSTSSEIATGTCEAGGTTLAGTVSFPAAVIQQGDRNIFAQHWDAADNMGESTPIGIIVDTEIPVLEFISPLCGSTLFETPADLAITCSESEATLYEPGPPRTAIQSDVPTVLGVVNFLDVDLIEGANDFIACAVDEHGQEGCTSACTFTLTVLAEVDFLDPTDGQIIGVTDDLDDGSPGCQYDVTFWADVSDGTGTTLSVDGTPVTPAIAYADPGVTYPSVTIPEGTSTLRAEEAGGGWTEIDVTCDLTGPTDPVDDLAVSLENRRAGSIRLDWTAPSEVTEYDIRCDHAEITSTNFDAAPQYAYTGSIGSPSDPQTQVIRNLGIDFTNTVWCAVKVLDDALNPSAISNIVNIDIVYNTIDIPAPTGASEFGYRPAPAGDVDGDGFEDLVVATNADNKAYLFFGNGTDGLDVDPTEYVTFTGPSGSFFGYSIAGLGNFDNDPTGYSDIAIGAIGANGWQGAVYVFSGRPRASWPVGGTLAHSSADITFNLDDPSSTDDTFAVLGEPVAPAGDFDGDTVMDLLTGANGWASGVGAVFVIRGRTFSSASIDLPGDGTTDLEGDFMILGQEAGSYFGAPASPAGLLDSGDEADILVNAPFASAGETVYAYYGQTSSGSGIDTISVPDVTIVTPVTGTEFGLALAGCGDINNDTYNDVVITADLDSTSRGAAYIYFGSAGGIDSTYDVFIDHSGTGSGGDRVGFTTGYGADLGFATLGRWNNDSISDLILSTYRWGTEYGAGLVFHGSTTFAPAQASDADVVFQNEPWTSRARVSYAGDIDGDGFSDLAVGFPNAASSAGAVSIIW